MKVEFKFTPGDKVTTSDGSEGTIAAACFEKGENFYSVRILTTKAIKGGSARTTMDWQYLPESELLAGWNCFQNTRKNGLAR